MVHLQLSIFVFSRGKSMIQNIHQITLCNPPFTVIMNGIFCKLLTNYVLKRILPKGVSADEYFESLIFPAKIQISKPVDVPYIGVYG